MSGGSGIRTHGAFYRTTDFKSVAIDRSAIPDKTLASQGCKYC